MREDPPIVTGETKASSKGNAFSSIQGRLVSLLLLVLVPILLAHAYFSYDRYQSNKRVESEANLHLARATAKSFDTFLQDVLHQETTIGLAFTSSQPLSEKEKSRILLEVQAGNPAVWHLFWKNPAGIVTAATGSQFIGMDLSDREYYREIVAGKEWVVSDLLLSKTTQQPSFTISRGIRNERGELLGVIVAGILPAKLDRVLAVERLGDAGVSLLDSKGMHAYRYPATQYTWEQHNWLKLYPIIGEVLKGKELVTNVVADRTGINRIAAFTPVTSIGWVATCSRAEEEVVGPIISATLQETGLILLVAFVSLLIAVALSRTISTSVIILRNHALSLGQGETQNPLTISRPVEIKDLAEAFNKMAEEIRSREKTLRESEQRYSALFANKINGMAHCRIITDEHGLPVDYLILQVNEAYERIIGVKKADIEDRTVTEVFPDIKKYSLDYIRMYGKIALEGGEIKFEENLEATGQCLSIYAYCPLPGEFITIFTDVTDRKEAEEKLKASLVEKEVMLKEIHHRVKNNLQIISSLVSMQADNLTDERTREEFADVCGRVRSMALIHEKLYQTDDLARLNFADYVASLLHSLWSSHDVLAEKVRLNLELTPVTLTIETAVPCGLILNELAGNALKHGFPNSSDGEVTVGMENDAVTDTVCLYVRDNGVGLAPDLDWRQTNSMGLRLVQILTGQLRGTVEKVIIGTGTEFRVTFPLNGSQ